MKTPQTEAMLDAALAKVAPGTPLYEALEMMLAAHTGALICIGDVENVLALGNGGFKINTAFTPQRAFELAKMDGAIIVDEDISTIVRANFHLNPDPEIPTFETGMRHRTAARTSSQTEALVISASQRRSVVNVYINGEGATLDSNEILMGKANQGILALENSRNTLDKSTVRLTMLELEDLATLGDVTRTIARYQNLMLTSAQVSRYIRYLGVNGDLPKMQHDEIMQGADEQFTLTIRDYASDASLLAAAETREELAHLTRDDLADGGRVAEVLGFERSMSDEDHVQPRGFRVMSRISMLSDAAALRIVEEYGSLSAIIDGFKEAGSSGLDDLDIQNATGVIASLSQLKRSI